MSRELLRNFCIEPKTRACFCPRLVRCGGLSELLSLCPEHGNNSAPADLMRTHFHEVKGFLTDSAKEFTGIYQKAS